VECGTFKKVAVTDHHGSSGVAFAVNSGEGYIKHCYCYLTKVTEHSATKTVTDTILYEGNRGQDNSELNDQWVFEAHHIYPHVAAIVSVKYKMHNNVI